jgi:hypothetical protein
MSVFNRVIKSILVLILPFTIFSQTWLQKGIDINGSNSSEKLGSAVAIADDGNIIAVGSPGNGTGTVRIFEWDSIMWVKKGSVINGVSTGDGFGSALEISTDGNTFIVGAPKNDDVGAQSGEAQVFEWNGFDWIQKGQDIHGQDDWDQCGARVDISADGNTIVVGTVSDIAGYNRGRVEVFTWNGSIWELKGSEIIGEYGLDYAGVVEICADGNTVIIGGPGNPNGSFIGHARIFEWTGTNWIQKGLDLEGDNNYDHFGEHVSINDDGTIVAVYTPDEGYTRVFKWLNNSWNQVGNDILTVSYSDRYVNTLDLSGDGLTIAIGCRCSYSTLYPNGAVSVYQWNETFWEVKANVIEGEYYLDGASVLDLNYSGNILIIGAEKNDFQNSNTDEGQVRVYEFDSICSPEDIPTISVSSIDEITGSDGSIDVTVNGGSGDFSYQWFGPNGFYTDIEDIDSLDDGIYTLVVLDKENCKVITEVEIFPNTTSIQNFDEIEISLFPNPTADIVNVKFENADIVYYSLTDFQGRMIVKKAINQNEFVVDLSSFESGLYFLNLKNKNQNFRYKIIKN